MRKLSWVLLMILVLAGCGDEPGGQAEMVLIPAGSFEMGDHLDGMGNAQPVHTVTLDGFYIDSSEVTVGQFKQFVNQSGYKPYLVSNEGWSMDRYHQNVAKYSPSNDHPIIYVGWNDAAAYAKWAGKRLPTEAEWEYAARGGLAGKRYPWGDEIDKTKAHYNSWNGGCGTTKAVGSFKANGYGLYDMAGNVWEWGADWYGSDYYGKSPAKNPPGPGTGSSRLLRGGSWRVGTGYIRVAARDTDNPLYGNYHTGFRCVSDLP